MDKLVIFDCDGVLVDSEIIASRIDAEALTSIGYEITPEESIKKFTGLSAKAARQMIFNETGKYIPSDHFSALKPLILKTFEKELLPLMTPILKLIKDAKVKRCVASNSPRDQVTRSLELTNQLMFFNDSSIFTSQQVPHAKPAPDLFLFAAHQMAFAPKDCIVIEDSTAGIEAARAAGMQVVGFLGGRHAHFDWYQEKVKAYNIPIAYTCEELLPLLKSLLAQNSF